MPNHAHSNEVVIDSRFVYSIDNRLTLDSPAVNDTTMIPGSRIIPPVETCSYGFFTGYVFRGDSRDFNHIFRLGFEVQEPFISEAQIPLISGTTTGTTHDLGVSTTVCSHVASCYGNTNEDGYGFPARGYVYLIDACHMAGFCIPTPRPEELLVAWYPILKRVYEVNFMHNIPAESIVGLVWPSDMPRPDLHFWTFKPSLYLAVNPEYDGGMEKARKVASLFNDVGSGWSNCTIL